MSLKNAINDLRKFLEGKGTPGTRHTWDRVDRMQRQEYAGRKPQAVRPRSKDPRYYRRPRA